MNTIEPSNGLDDGIELVSMTDGYAWVDTDCDGPGTRIVESVEVIDYAFMSCDIGGVQHLQIAELESDGDGVPVPSTSRTLWSSHWVDIDEMR